MTAARALVQLATGFITARAIYVAAKLGIADLLDKGPREASELAEELAVDPQTLFRILRLLASAGIFKRSASGQFALAELGDPLRTASPQSMRDYIILFHEFQYPVFTNVTHQLTTGQSAHLKTFGQPIFDLVQSDSELAKVFFAGLASRARYDIAAVMDAYDFSRARQIVDIGGGNGGLLSAILLRYPHISGELFDLSPAIAEASSGRGGALPRCTLTVGNFFENVPAGADIYLLKLVLHDWEDEDARRILKNCRRVMRPNGWLLIVEGLLGESNTLGMTDLGDLVMMLSLSGRERTEAEFKNLLQSAGFKFRKKVATKADVFILEAEPA
jgi:SAM-dependent methyltransferase